MLDRLIQQAIQQVLTPVFDPGFSESSHCFRPNRSAHGATKQVQRTIRRGRRFVVDMDLSKFFDRVQHDVLMSRVARKVRDKRVLRLIGRYLRAGVMVEGVLQSSPEGTPQGGPLSPLLANILLDDLDKELERRGLPFVRTRVQNLLALGVSRRQAFRHAKSRQGPWHMAKTIASGVGMTNAWLHDQGLVSLKSHWVKRAPLRRTA